MNGLLKLAWILPLLWSLTSCEHTNTYVPPPTLQVEACKPYEAPFTYLFLGHIYRPYSFGGKIDPRVELIDKSCYDAFWLGGDVCTETTRDAQTMVYLDSIFDIDQPGNFWAVGNHDIRNGNWDYITSATQRPLFYTESFNGLTAVVLNTNLDKMHESDSATMCSRSQEQWDMLEKVTDTIQHSNHLVIISHNVMWHDVQFEAWKYSNATKYDWRFLCDDSATFGNLLYPRLVAVQQRGIPVTVVGGDVGQGDFGGKKKRGHWISPEGIRFLGSGIANGRLKSFEKFKGARPDYILALQHFPETGELIPDFLLLDSLVADQYQLSPREVFAQIEQGWEEEVTPD